MSSISSRSSPTSLEHSTGGASPSFKQPNAAAFIQTFGYPFQLVALHSETGRVIVLYAGDDAALARSIVQLRKLNLDGWNVYYEVNPGAQGRRSSKADITSLRAVVGDADAKDGRSMDECLIALSALPLPPSFTLATGGGVQVVYLLSKLVQPTADNSATYGQIGQAVRDLIVGDGVFDLPRIMRLPGFMNWPNKKKRAAGREPAKATVYAASGRHYSLAELSTAFLKTNPQRTARLVVNSDLTGVTVPDHWFSRLSPDERNACLAEMLKVPSVAALADTSDAAPPPNWRTVLAACARSNAPNAYSLCQAWAQTSPRFDPQDFESRYGSYCDD